MFFGFENAKPGNPVQSRWYTGSVGRGGALYFPISFYCKSLQSFAFSTRHTENCHRLYSCEKSVFLQQARTNLLGRSLYDDASAALKQVQTLGVKNLQHRWMFFFFDRMLQQAAYTIY